MPFGFAYFDVAHFAINLFGPAPTEHFNLHLSVTYFWINFAIASPLTLAFSLSMPFSLINLSFSNFNPFVTSKYASSQLDPITWSVSSNSAS